jgi:hypothetical protein
VYEGLEGDFRRDPQYNALIKEQWDLQGQLASANSGTEQDLIRQRIRLTQAQIEDRLQQVRQESGVTDVESAYRHGLESPDRPVVEALSSVPAMVAGAGIAGAAPSLARTAGQVLTGDPLAVVGPAVRGAGQLAERGVLALADEGGRAAEQAAEQVQNVTNLGQAGSVQAGYAARLGGSRRRRRGRERQCPRRRQPRRARPADRGRRRRSPGGDRSGRSRGASTAVPASSSGGDWQCGTGRRHQHVARAARLARLDPLGPREASSISSGWVDGRASSIAR